MILNNVKVVLFSMIFSLIVTIYKYYDQIDIKYKDKYVKNLFSSPIKKHLNSSIGNYDNLNYNEETKNLELFFKNKTDFLKILKEMKKDSVEKLQIVSDFDYTISSFFQKDKKSNNFPLIRSLLFAKRNLLFEEKLMNLRKIYIPIEMDPNITKKEKEEKMLEWYEQIEQLIIEEKLHKEKILEGLNKTPILIRHYFFEFLNFCKKINIPLYIISGGILNFMVSIFDKMIDLNDYHNIFFFSNELKFDKNNVCTGFNKEVTPGNKDKVLKDL